MVKVLDSHTANSGPIPGTTYGTQALSGVIPDFRFRNKPWTLVGVAQKHVGEP